LKRKPVEPLKKRLFKLGKKAVLYTLLIGSPCLLVQVPSVHAGKEGVFLANDTYFTLENASFSAGAASSTMQFVINLHNGSMDDIDFNNYGVRLIDELGNRYPAKLISKQTARVAPGQDQSFRFFSEVTPNIRPDQLKVNFYSWDGSQPDSSSSLGDLSVSAAVPADSEASKQLLISLHDINSSYPQDAFVSLRLGSSYQLAEGGSSYLYTDLYVQNGGSSTVQLPSGLQLRLKGKDASTYSGTLTGGSSNSLLPGKMTKLSLRTAVSDTFDAGQYTLEPVYEDSSGERIAGSFPISGTTVLSSIGSEQPYSLYGTDNGLTVMAEKAAAIKQADGYLVQTTVKISNSGAKIVTLPSLSAAYVFGTESMNAGAQDQSVQSGFLSPGQTATFRYAVVLPEGIDPKTASFALFEQKPAATNSAGSGSSSASLGNAGSSQSQSPSANGSNNTNASTGSGTDSTTSSASNTNNAGSSSSNSGSSTGNSSTTGSGSNSGNSSGSSASSNKAGSSDKSPVMLVSLSNIEQSDNRIGQALSYQPGTPLSFAPNGLIDKNLEVSLVELHLHENSDFGYKTAVAKYKLTNQGASTLSMPNLGTELINSQGLAFTGERQTAAADKLAPNTSYVVSYSYLLPASEDGKQLALNFTDPKSTSSGKLSIGTYQVAVQPESSDERISFYPFEVSFDDYRINTLYSSGNYTYRLDLELTVDMKESVIVDQNFSQMEFELVDSLNRILGSQTMSFTGTQKLISGSQRIDFASIKTDQFENGLVINVYETINTPSGPAKRLVKQLKQ
jgi:hypothetical protein